MTLSRNFAFFSPQGDFFQKNQQFMQKQGSTAECGGQVIYVLEAARALASLGHKVNVFARNYSTDQIEFETIENCPGVQIFHIPTSAPHHIQKEDFYPYYAEYLAKTIRVVEDNKLHFDAIIGHYADGMFIGTGLESYIDSTTGRKTPLIGITHSIGLEKAESFLIDPKISTTEKFNHQIKKCNIHTRLGCEIAALNKMDGMICVSQHHMKLLFTDYGFFEDQMAIIPGGANQKTFSNFNLSATEKHLEKDRLIAEALSHRTDIANSSREHIRNDNIIFGFGRLVEAKGVFNAVKSMEFTLKRFPNSVYVYAGGNIPPQNAEEKDLYDRCMAHAEEKGYKDRIIFLGRQDQKDIARWLNVSSVYLHAAYLEPFGLAPIEAAITGIPTVISKEAGVAELMENNEHTLHTNPEDPSDISKQVSRIINNPLLASRLADEAQDVINQHATWDARAKQIVNFLVKEVESLYFPNREKRTRTDNPFAPYALAALGSYDTTKIGSDIQDYFSRSRTALSHIVNENSGEIKNPALDKLVSIEKEFMIKRSGGGTENEPA